MRSSVGLAAAVAVVLSACGGDGGGTSTPDNSVASVTVTPGGSQTVAQGSTRTLTATAKNASNATVSGQSFAWTTSDPTKVSLSATTGASITATATGIGTSTVAVTVTGTTRSASVPFNVTVPGTVGLTATVNTPGATFSPATTDILAGGTVTWNIDGDHNVTFSTAGSPADIPRCLTCSASRQFAATGTFNYSCTVHAGMNGSIRVQ